MTEMSAKQKMSLIEEMVYASFYYLGLKGVSIDNEKAVITLVIENWYLMEEVPADIILPVGCGHYKIKAQTYSADVEVRSKKVRGRGFGIGR